MTPEQYRAIRDAFGLSHDKMGNLIGVGSRQSKRYAAEGIRDGATVERLLLWLEDTRQDSNPEYLAYVIKLIGG